LAVNLKNRRDFMTPEQAERLIRQISNIDIELAPIALLFALALVAFVVWLVHGAK
jgi:hypothetical protein